MNAKKLMLCAMAAGMVSSAACAQDYYESQRDEIDSLRQEVAELNAERQAEKEAAMQKRLWGYGRYKRISYVNQSMTRASYNGLPSVTWKPDYGVGVQIGNTYHLPHKPIGGILKFGIDATWIDFSYSKYKSAEFKGGGSNDLGTDSNGIPNFNFPEDYPETEFMLGDLGVHQLTMSMGVGVSANVAPFAFSSNKNLQYLKCQVYGHFLMGGSAILYDDPDTGDTEVNLAALPQGACGFSVNWRQLGIGIEGRWGSAKYNNLVSESDLYDDEEEGAERPKVSFKNASFRVYLNFHF